MSDSGTKGSEIVTFLRKRDYALVRDLGSGACGRTVLLFDDQIGEHFVCKKYSPYSEDERKELFEKFCREIKLLHKLHHENVVRVFNYFLYPDNMTGYILMEHVDGALVDDYLRQRPEQTNEVFVQTINGFSYLERCGVLHRDIRPGNLMVRSDGIVKIIDLGFGKHVEVVDDFNKSISLNLWCERPLEFNESRYDFSTEVYFVGKPFERIIRECEIGQFRYTEILRRMCEYDPESRAPSFTPIETEIKNSAFHSAEFLEWELRIYREFASMLAAHITKADGAVRYEDDVSKIKTRLNDAYQRFMLEQEVPSANLVVNCFLSGTYFYKSRGMRVSLVKDFLQLMQASSDDKNRIILANLHTRLDTVKRYEEKPDAEDDIPF